MWIILLVFLVILFCYSFYAYKKSLLVKSKILTWLYVVFIAFFAAGLLFMWHRQAQNYLTANGFTNLIISVSLGVFIFLLSSLILFFIGDVIRFFFWLFQLLNKRVLVKLPQRPKWLGYTNAIAGAVLFVLILYGNLFGFTYYKIHRIHFEHSAVPQSFDGFTIAQISDLHLGTFGSIKQVKKGIDLLQAQNPDMLVFTGDMVNNISNEALPYIPLLKSLEAPYGKFAILGNHDYAHYASHLNTDDQNKDVNQLRKYIEQMGFTLLENSHQTISINNDTLYVAGVENWGVKPFPQYGKLNKALHGISDTTAFVLLLSHDPSHWTEKVVHSKVPVALTLSGHTHGMQFGIEIGNFRWSPVQIKYKKWAGMHSSFNKYLYINRGFGGIGYAGRVGICPEITLITFKSTQAH